MDKIKLVSSIKIIDLDWLKYNKFHFIKDAILRENVAMKMQYIAFLVSFEEQYRIPNPIRHSLFKTITIFTASIVESLIHYKLREMLALIPNQEGKIMGRRETFFDRTEIYKLSSEESIIGVRRVYKARQLNDECNFSDLNKAAKKIGLFDQELFDQSEELRKARNKIHPYSLKEIDDKYSKQKINSFFSTASSIVEKITFS